MRRFQISCIIASLVLLTTGCGRPAVEVIDLNGVLTIMASVLDEQNAASQMTEKSAAEDENQLTDDESVAAAMLTQSIATTERDTATEQDFAQEFSKRLNEAKLLSTPIGVSVDETGDVIGFTDSNRNNIRESGDNQLFKVQVDPAGERLIASDQDGHSRPHHYRGFGSGMFLGYMLSRNMGYYSGSRAAAKPDFSKRAMSPQNYHSSAVSKARTKASAFRNSSASSRSRSGSGGFSFGK